MGQCQHHLTKRVPPSSSKSHSKCIFKVGIVQILWWSNSKVKSNFAHLLQTWRILGPFLTSRSFSTLKLSAFWLSRKKGKKNWVMAFLEDVSGGNRRIMASTIARDHELHTTVVFKKWPCTKKIWGFSIHTIWFFQFLCQISFRTGKFAMWIKAWNWTVWDLLDSNYPKMF